MCLISDHVFKNAKHKFLLLFEEVSLLEKLFRLCPFCIIWIEFFAIYYIFRVFSIFSIWSELFNHKSIQAAQVITNSAIEKGIQLVSVSFAKNLKFFDEKRHLLILAKIMRDQRRSQAKFNLMEL